MKDLVRNNVGKMNELDRKRAFYKHSDKDFVKVDEYDFNTCGSNGMVVNKIVSDLRFNESCGIAQRNHERAVARNNNWNAHKKGGNK